MHRPVQHLKGTRTTTVHMRIDGKENRARHQARLWHTRSTSFPCTHSSTVSVAEHLIHRHLGSSGSYLLCLPASCAPCLEQQAVDAVTPQRMNEIRSHSLWRRQCRCLGWTSSRHRRPSGLSLTRAATRNDGRQAGGVTQHGGAYLSLSLSHFFLRIYFFELFIKSSFLIVLVQTLRILFNFTLFWSRVWNLLTIQSFLKRHIPNV